MMEKATITTREFLVEGGCNACGLLNCCTYTIHFENSPEQTVENMDEASLVTALILKDGWRQGVETVGIGDDVIFYQKAGEKVYLKEDSFKTVFEKGTDTMSFPKFKQHDRADLPVIFGNTNKVGQAFFGIPAYDIEMLDD